MRLEGKVVVITGSTFGIGMHTAFLFAREGANIVVAGRTVEAGEKVVKQIEDEGGQAVFARTDVTVDEDVKGMIATAVNTYGKLDILFNNAGVAYGSYDFIQDRFTGPHKAAEEPEVNWRETLDVNVMGTYRGIKYAVPEMIKNGGGSIINNSSVAGIIGSGASVASYNASKAAVILLTKQAAIDYAADKIRVNSILPGDITLVSSTPEDYTPKIIEEWGKHQPYPRAGHPTDIAYAALYLASDESEFVTGESLVVDGGMTIGH